MNQTARTVLRELPSIGAFKLGTFRLKLHETNPMAPLSPFYINLRDLRSFPDLLVAAAAAIAAEVRNLQFDRLADVPTAATPIVSAMVVRERWPMISPRMDKKQHGTGDEIDGVFSPGQTVLVVDDLVTSAASKLEAIRKLEGFGLVVKDVAVFLDRQQGGREELARSGYQLHAAVNLDELFEVIYEAKVLSPEAEDFCRKYRRGELSSGWEKNVTSGWDKIVTS